MAMSPRQLRWFFAHIKKTAASASSAVGKTVDRARLETKLAARIVGGAPITGGLAGSLAAANDWERTKNVKTIYGEPATKEQRAAHAAHVGLRAGVVYGVAHSLAAGFPSGRRKAERWNRRRSTKFHNALENEMGTTGGGKLAADDPFVKASMRMGLPERIQPFENIMHPFKAARAKRILLARHKRYVEEFKRGGIAM